MHQQEVGSDYFQLDMVIFCLPQVWCTFRRICRCDRFDAKKYLPYGLTSALCDKLHRLKQIIFSCKNTSWMITVIRSPQETAEDLLPQPSQLSAGHHEVQLPVRTAQCSQFDLSTCWSKSSVTWCYRIQNIAVVCESEGFLRAQIHLWINCIAYNLDFTWIWMVIINWFCLEFDDYGFKRSRWLELCRPLSTMDCRMLR